VPEGIKTKPNGRVKNSISTKRGERGILIRRPVMGVMGEEECGTQYHGERTKRWQSGNSGWIHQYGKSGGVGFWGKTLGPVPE